MKRYQLGNQGKKEKEAKIRVITILIRKNVNEESGAISSKY
jgi:hypothetical protein